MSSVNKVIIIGYLGADPETRYTADGSAVASFRVATTERWKDKASGEAQERTEWHRIVSFGKLAEIAGEYLAKGALAYVEGRLQTRKWQDKDGNDRYTTEIVADTVRFLSRAPGRDADTSGGDAPERPAKPAAAKPPAKPAPKPAGGGSGFDDMDSDIPFLYTSLSVSYSTGLERARSYVREGVFCLRQGKNC